MLIIIVSETVLGFPPFSYPFVNLRVETHPDVWWCKGKEMAICRRWLPVFPQFARPIKRESYLEDASKVLSVCNIDWGCKIN